jgi:hypothetical protein
VPIKPENAARYPANWNHLAREAKERSGWKCVHMGCGARQYAVGVWEGDVWHELGHVGHELFGAYKDARQMAAEIQWERCGDEPNAAPKVIVIVLTTAHLDHEPENCAPENLAPMCQRHHLAYDAKHHAETAYTTRKAKANTLDLFEAKA